MASTLPSPKELFLSLSSLQFFWPWRPSVAKSPPAGVVRKFEERMPTQMQSSSSASCSKLRGPSQNSPHSASKWDINITKLNFRQWGRNSYVKVGGTTIDIYAFRSSSIHPSTTMMQQMFIKKEATIQS
ncbi:hypothetical protein AVEN_160806-1 [Araneus ventricosus]|uniref:Uncharacterized protein n=1 Tax=Araneus ventricosus TaxID=182803 RepID=A0A4Y2U9H1_ARAVE|nr:hypothetical protein AVEN_160806-1 [Araneus ventricosus]